MSYPLLLLASIASVWMAGCDSNREPKETAPYSLIELNEATVPFAVAAADGALLLPRLNAAGELDGALVSANGQTVGTTLDDQGRPLVVTTNGYTVVFGNYRSQAVDVAVTRPDGTILTQRDVPLSASLAALISAQTTQAALSKYARADWKSMAKTMAGALLIAAELGITLSSVAALTPAMATLAVSWGMAKTVLSAYALARSDGDEWLEIFLATEGAKGQFKAITSCSRSYFACATALGSIALTEWDNLAIYLESELTRLAQSVIVNGGGDVQVTLTWDNTADVDLWITDPAGERIYYAHTSSASGGRLDVDDTNGYGPENVFWAQGRAPQGSYLVQVDHYEGPSPAPFTVLIQSFGQSKVYRGTVSANSTVTVARFTSGQPLPSRAAAEQVRLTSARAPK